MEAALIGAIVTGVIAAVLLIVLVSICICYTARHKREHKGDTQNFENIPRFEFLSRYGSSSDRDSFQTASEGSTDGHLPLHANRMFRPMPSDIRSLGPYTTTPKKQKRIKEKKKNKKNKSNLQYRFPYLDERELARRHTPLELTSGTVREDTLPQGRDARAAHVFPNTESRGVSGGIRFTPHEVHTGTDRDAGQPHAYPTRVIFHDPQYASTMVRQSDLHRDMPIKGDKAPPRQVNGYRDLQIRRNQIRPLDRPSRIQFSPIDLRRGQSFLNRDPNNISIISTDSAFHTSLDMLQSRTRPPPSPPYDMSSTNSQSIDTQSYPVQYHQHIPLLGTDRVISRSRPISFRYGRSTDIDDGQEINMIGAMESVEYARVIRPGREQIGDATTGHRQGYADARYSPMYTRKISKLERVSSSESGGDSEVAQYFVYQRAPGPPDIVLGNKENKHRSSIKDDNDTDPIYSTVHKVSKQTVTSPVSRETSRVQNGTARAALAQTPAQSSFGNYAGEPSAKIYCTNSGYRSERSGRSPSIPLPSPPRTRHVARVILTDSHASNTLHPPKLRLSIPYPHNSDDCDGEIDRKHITLGHNLSKNIPPVNGYAGITPTERIHKRMPMEKSSTAKLKSKKRFSIKLRKTKSFNEASSAAAEITSSPHAYCRSDPYLPNGHKSRNNTNEHVTVTSFRRLPDTTLSIVGNALGTSNHKSVRDHVENRKEDITSDIIKTEIHDLSPFGTGRPIANLQEVTYTELPYLTDRETGGNRSVLAGSKMQPLNQAIPPPSAPPPPPPVSSIPNNNTQYIKENFKTLTN